ncbi:MAG: ATP-dependent helicase, partial [Flavobacterium sp.]|nr:ATP-dependent helicase [Flavobacterium sp.]
EELLDNVNILYVALTRAEEQLYIISDYVKPNKEGVYPNNMASFFIKYLESLSEFNFDENILSYDFGIQAKLSLSEKHIDSSKTIPFVTSVLNPKNIKIAQREALMWGTQRQDAIEYGNLIHEILSFVNNKNEVNLAIEKALENGLIKQSQKEAVTKTIIEIVNHKDLSDFFTSNDIVLNEQVIIQQTSPIVKPDRMVLKKNQEVYLLDYKTGAHQSKYALQIENYQKAIEEMGFKVVKKALVYIGEKTNVVNF